MTDVDEMFVNRVHIGGIAVRSQTHEFVLSGIHPESGEVGEGGVKQPDGVGEVHVVEDLDLIPGSFPDRTGGPFAHPVQGENGRALKGRGEKRAGRMGLVMLRKQNVLRHGDAHGLQCIFDLQRRPQFLLHPQRHRHEEVLQPSGSHAEVGFHDAAELGDRFVVERHRIQIIRSQSRFLEAVLHGMNGEAVVVFLPGEPFLLCGGNDFTIPQQRRGGVMVKRADSQNVHQLCLL